MMFRSGSRIAQQYNVPLRLTRTRLCPSLDTNQQLLIAAGFSTQNTPDDNNNSPSSSPPRQSFVTERFTPGEYDRHKNDPLYRPPIKHKARVISAEDFANRPKVTFYEEFDSLHDAGIVLSWLTAQDRDEIYQMYLDTMENMKASGDGKTSHEYAMQVVGQHYNITAVRVGGIVELAHLEDRRRQNGDEELFDDVQAYADRKILEHVRVAYSEFNEPEPQVPFVEPAAPYEPHPLQRQVVRLEGDELRDLDQELWEVAKKDQEKMQRILDEKIFVEDRDYDKKYVKIDNQAQQLLDNRRFFDKSIQRKLSNNTTISTTTNEPPSSPRWKYVAKVIDSASEKARHKRDKKKLTGRKLRRRQQQLAQNNNTLVEYNGTLRVATVAEASATEWSNPINRRELIYKSAKSAWLEKTLRGEVGGWGRAAVLPAEEKMKKAMVGGEDSTIVVEGGSSEEPNDK